MPNNLPYSRHVEQLTSLYFSQKQEDQQQRMTSGCLWKKASAMPIKPKTISPSPGLSRTLNHWRLRKSSGKASLHACPVLTSASQTSAAERPGNEQDRRSDTLMSEHCNTETTTRKYLQSFQHDNIQTFSTHGSWRNATNLVLQVGNWGREQFSKFSKTPRAVVALSHSSEARLWSRFF